MRVDPPEPRKQDSLLNTLFGPAGPGARRAEEEAAAQRSGLSLEERITAELASGGRLESRTATTAVIIHGQRVSHLLHFFIGVFTLGLWWIVWLILAASGGKRRVVLSDTPKQGAASPQAPAASAASERLGTGGARGDGETADRLRDLKALHDDGVLTDEEYEQRRARLVEEL